MLVMADSRGRVLGSIPGLAHRACVTLENTQLALERFLAPDPFSRTKEHEGRRIEEIDGGWRLLNYLKYREMRDEEDRREYLRKHKAQSRAKAKAKEQEPRTSRRRANAQALVGVTQHTKPKAVKRGELEKINAARAKMKPPMGPLTLEDLRTGMVS
jgi:hypothetical protein